MAGFGAGGGGWLEVLDDASADSRTRAWVRTSWALYNQSANGETHPAVGNVDADAAAEIVIGLGSFAGNGGWVEIVDDTQAGNASLGWRNVGWDPFIMAGGSTYPAIGRLR